MQIHPFASLPFRKRPPAKRSLPRGLSLSGLSGLSGLFALLALTGCYTQLATRGYGAPERTPADPYAQAEPAPGDSRSGDSARAGSADAEAARSPEADTLVPRDGTPTVIVNNYYDDRASYRGYSSWEWDYPALSFGFYSSRYYRYSRPWWWDDPWYSRRHSHYHHHSYGHGHYRGPSHRHPRPGTPAPSGPYKSEKRLFNPDPSYPAVRKGRRSDQPVGAVREEAGPPPAYHPPASKSGGGSPSGGEGSSSSSSSGGSQEAGPSRDEARQDGTYPTFKKGRRR